MVQDLAMRQSGKSVAPLALRLAFSSSRPDFVSSAPIALLPSFNPNAAISLDAFKRELLEYGRLPHESQPYDLTIEVNGETYPAKDIITGSDYGLLLKKIKLCRKTGPLNISIVRPEGLLNENPKTRLCHSTLVSASESFLGVAPVLMAENSEISAALTEAFHQNPEGLLMVASRPYQRYGQNGMPRLIGLRVKNMNQIAVLSSEEAKDLENLFERQSQNGPVFKAEKNGQIAFTF